MNSFDYTDKYIPESSFIKEIWYNKNNKDLALNLSGAVYYYKNVEASVVNRMIAKGNSPGRIYYEEVQTKSGPGDLLKNATFYQVRNSLVVPTVDSKSKPKQFEMDIYTTIDGKDHVVSLQNNSVGSAVADFKETFVKYGLETKIKKVVVHFNE